MELLDRLHQECCLNCLHRCCCCIPQAACATLDSVPSELAASIAATATDAKAGTRGVEGFGGAFGTSGNRVCNLSLFAASAAAAAAVGGGSGGGGQQRLGQVAAGIICCQTALQHAQVAAVSQITATFTVFLMVAGDIGGSSGRRPGFGAERHPSMHIAAQIASATSLGMVGPAAVAAAVGPSGSNGSGGDNLPSILEVDVGSSDAAADGGPSSVRAFKVEIEEH